MTWGVTQEVQYRMFFPSRLSIHIYFEVAKDKKEPQKPAAFLILLPNDSYRLLTSSNC
jgi:hypothetical protein